MPSLYELEQAAGTAHRELSFDVDGRFVHYVGVSVTEGDDGVLHLVVSLTEKSAEEPAAADEETAPLDAPGPEEVTDV